MAPATQTKIIEHYRHALRSKPSPHLNAEGVRIARKLGERLSSYDLVITSPKKRAVETAVAMGFAVEKTVKILKDIPRDVETKISYQLGFSAFAETIPEEPSVQAYLETLRGFHSRILEKVPDGGRALLVSHGGLVEWCALAVFPKAAEWGGPLDKCEGIRLVFEGEKCVEGSPIRLPKN